ncbi:hypothetical protein [Brucella pseudogrignonensis]|uniref:DUF551 domain-containing protein n=1 Tax=Brucella pseudogrignonensis TaxID=419475 RepID=A0ABU1M5D5_9HYPH|nr:hypothetical protein [Brucella pseudogrignonensis]MDR6431249.1 hypothetical protein [Brucella pseudogrignonensis]
MTVLTNESLATAFDAVWNSAITEAHNRGSSAALDFAFVLACGFQAMAEELRQDGWLPIESAVKDETPRLIGWFDEAGHWETRRAWWVKEHHRTWNDDKDESETVGAWTDDAVASWHDEEVKAYSPTHFMALPQGPSRLEGKE